MADASAPLLDLFDQIARRGAEFEWSAVDVAPSLFTVLLTGTAVLGVLLCSVSRRPARYLIFSVAAACVIVWAPVLPLQRVGGVLEVHLVDVGQGDAIAVKLPDGRWILFDAGRAWRGGDAGRRTLIPYIRRHGGELYAFVLSHPHSDHVGGAESVIRWLRPRIFWDAAYVAANDDYLAALRVSRENGVDWRRVRPGYTVEAGGAKLEFLAPDSAWTASLDDANEASAVVMLRYGDISLLLTGDAEREEEAWLAARYGARLRATVLKVGHHGSSTSTTEGFLRLVQPRIALVSVGRGNRYGHPSESVLQSLASAGAVVVRTDRHGTAVLSTDGRGLWLEALGERWKVQ
jgi:competence protein ComEC